MKPKSLFEESEVKRYLRKIITYECVDESIIKAAPDRLPQHLKRWHAIDSWKISSGAPAPTLLAKSKRTIYVECHHLPEYKGEIGKRESEWKNWMKSLHNADKQETSQKISTEDGGCLFVSVLVFWSKVITMRTQTVINAGGNCTNPHSSVLSSYGCLL
jgi:hypothetical protein